jgi:hypothetical protein
MLRFGFGSVGLMGVGLFGVGLGLGFEVFSD